jgi:hypothetical protein
MRTDRTVDRTWLRRHARRWVDAGLMSAEQADAVVRFEHPEVERELGEVTPRLGLLAEATVYVGSVLALLAGAFVMGQSWDSVPVPVRVLVGLVVTGLGLGGGRIVVRIGDAGALRLAGFLRAIGAAGAGFAAGVTAVESDAPDWVIGVSVGVVLSAVGIALWRNLDRPLQMFTTVAGAIAIGVGIASSVQPPGWIVGASVWVAGLLFGAAGMTQRLRPPVYVASVGAVAMILGAFGAIDLLGDAGLFAVMATAAAVVVAGVAMHTVPVLAIGVLGLLQSTVQALATLVRGAVGLIVVMVIGVAMVVIVLDRARRRPS